MISSQELQGNQSPVQDNMAADNSYLGNYGLKPSDSTMDDTGAPNKLPDSVIPKFDYLDKFEKSSRRKNKDGSSGFSGKNSQQQETSKKRVPKEDAIDFYNATPRTLSAGLFPVIDQMAVLIPEEPVVEDDLDSFDIDEAFKNWNDSLKSEPKTKRKPPAISDIKPVYIRQHYQKNRSAHMWKTDPKVPWILTYGPPTAPNNKVIEILFKYQNNTIDAKA